MKDHLLGDVRGYYRRLDSYPHFVGSHFKEMFVVRGEYTQGIERIILIFHIEFYDKIFVIGQKRISCNTNGIGICSACILLAIPSDIR